MPLHILVDATELCNVNTVEIHESPTDIPTEAGRGDDNNTASPMKHIPFTSLLLIPLKPMMMMKSPLHQWLCLSPPFRKRHCYCRCLYQEIEVLWPKEEWYKLNTEAAKSCCNKEASYCYREEGICGKEDGEI